MGHEFTLRLILFADALTTAR